MAAKKKEDFEPLHRRLEETVQRLEEGDLTLEESLDLYEEGVKLARRCQELLQDAKLRVSQLGEAFGAEDEESEEERETSDLREGFPLDDTTGSP